jgi:hypothetical protein
MATPSIATAMDAAPARERRLDIAVAVARAAVVVGVVVTAVVLGDGGYSPGAVLGVVMMLGVMVARGMRSGGPVRHRPRCNREAREDRSCT